MDSSNAPHTQQTAHTSIFDDDDDFDLFVAAADVSVSSPDVGSQDNIKVDDTSGAKITDPLDDLFDFCSLPTVPVEVDYCVSYVNVVENWFLLRGET